MNRPLILGSASPRRQAFFHALGLDFKVVVADIDETHMPQEEPVALALRLATQKAAAVAARVWQDAPASLIVAADTVVAQSTQLLGKPESAAEATSMLQTLRRAPHMVVSGLCVRELGSGHTRAAANVATVTMRDYSDREIAAYVASGDPMDKAGAYAIQHAAFNPVAQLDGCYASVMGLPMGDLVDFLDGFGVTVNTSPASVCRAQGARVCCLEHG